jgi:hypothetical protein
MRQISGIPLVLIWLGLVAGSWYVAYLVLLGGLSLIAALDRLLMGWSLS